MFKKIQNLRFDRFAHHLAVASLVVFLLVVNFTMYNYASAQTGVEMDTKINSVIISVADTYERSATYMYEYSVTWGELLLEWEDFIVDTYYLTK